MPSAISVHRGFEVGALVEPGADQGEFAPEEAVQVHLPGLWGGWRPGTAGRARRGRRRRWRRRPGRRRPRRRRPRRRRRSTPAPARHVVVAGSQARQAELLGQRRRWALGSTTRTSAPVAVATRAIRTPTGPPPTTRPARRCWTAARATSCTATAVGSTSAARCQGQGVGQGDEGVGGDGPALLHGAGGVDADEVQVLADVLVAALAGGAGAVLAQGHHGDRLARGDSRARPAPTRIDASGHLVSEHGGRA